MFMRPLLILTLAPAILAQDPQPLVVPGQVLSGGEIVNSAGLVAINNEGVAVVLAGTDHPSSWVFLRDGVPVVRGGHTATLPPGVSLSGPRAPSVNIQGDSGWTFKLAGASSVFEDSVLFFNDRLAIRAGDVCTAPELSPGSVYSKLFRAAMNDSNQLVVVSSVEDLAIPGAGDAALMRVDLDASGSVIAESAFLKEGDAAPGIPGATVSHFGDRPHQVVINDRGDIMFNAFLTTGSPLQAIYINSTPVAVSGTPSPVPGHTWGCMALVGGIDMNNVGDYVIKASLYGPGGGTVALVKNGAVFVRTGVSIPAIGGVVLTAIGSRISINDRGEVLWTGVWRDPPVGGPLQHGLFLDGELMVHVDVTTIGGRVVDNIPTIGDHCDMSRNGRYIAFRARLEPLPGNLPGNHGMYLIERDLLGLSYCVSTVNSTGNAATLSAAGSPRLVDQDVTLTGQGLPAGVPGLFFFGPDQVQLALGDGFRCVGGTVRAIAPVVKADPAGIATRQLDFNAPYAAGLLPGTTNFQLWYRDPLGPGGSGSNLSPGLEVVFQ